MELVRLPASRHSSSLHALLQAGPAVHPFHPPNPSAGLNHGSFTTHTSCSDHTLHSSTCQCCPGSFTRRKLMSCPSLLLTPHSCRYIHLLLPQLPHTMSAEVLSVIASKPFIPAGTSISSLGPNPKFRELYIINWPLAFATC